MPVIFFIITVTQLMIAESEILDLLKRIEQRELTIIPAKDPYEIYSGNVTYQVSNGWEIVVYSDANTWDYLDSVKAPDGRYAVFDVLDTMLSIRNYYPPSEVAQELYKIPLEE